jgi:hypothetical protein
MFTTWVEINSAANNNNNSLIHIATHMAAGSWFESPSPQGGKICCFALEQGSCLLKGNNTCFPVANDMDVD